MGNTDLFGVRWQARVRYSGLTQKGARQHFGLRISNRGLRMWKRGNLTESLEVRSWEGWQAEFNLSLKFMPVPRRPRPSGTKANYKEILRVVFVET
jgi:hypothetical protein